MQGKTLFKRGFFPYMKRDEGTFILFFFAPKVVFVRYIFYVQLRSSATLVSFGLIDLK